MKEDIGMEKKKYSIKEDFSMLALLIIPVGVAVNFVGGQLASILKLPMYLDTIGTIFAAMLCGPWVELQVEVHLLSQQPQWQQEPTSGQHFSVQKEYSRY